MKQIIKVLVIGTAHIKNMTEHLTSLLSNSYSSQLSDCKSMNIIDSETQEFLDKVQPAQLVLPKLIFINAEEYENEKDDYDKGSFDLVLNITNAGAEEYSNQCRLNIEDLRIMDVYDVANDDQANFLEFGATETTRKHGQLFSDLPITEINILDLIQNILPDIDQISADLLKENTALLKQLYFLIINLILKQLKLLLVVTGESKSDKVQVWLTHQDETWKDFAYSIHTNVGKKSNFVSLKNYSLEKVNNTTKITHNVIKHMIIRFS